jgi:hypothetical protein
VALVESTGGVVLCRKLAVFSLVNLWVYNHYTDVDETTLPLYSTLRYKDNI